MAIYGYTKNYKLIKPQFNTDTWHDYIYDNLDTIDAVMSAIYASGNWKGFWAKNMTYVAGDVIIDQDTDTMYKVMIDHVTSADTFAAEQTAHPDYYELWSPNNLAESWAIKTDGKVSNTDYSAKAYAISSGLIDDGSAKEWAVGSGAIGNTNEYSAKKYATDAHNDYVSLTTNVNVVAVGSNIANVNAVGQSISNVNTVASNISSVNVAAANIEFIKSAENNANDAKNSKIEAQNSAVTAQLMATQAQDWAIKTDGKVDGAEYSSKYYAGKASTSANNSHIWAEGTDAQVQALGGVHSSKGWAEQSTNANIALTNSPYTTNRILEIPQNIKLELNNGTLTLKAGSKVYVPNGFEADGTTPKFDVVTIESDKTTTLSGYTGKFYCSYVKELDDIFCQNISESGSGTSPTSGLYYNTSTNIIDVEQGYHYSFPLSENTANGTQLVSIDQVFNGFGYIGSTTFILPGVKWQRCAQSVNYGKNADGTNASVIRSTSSVLLVNHPNTVTSTHYICVSDGGGAARYTSTGSNIAYYDESKNAWYNESSKSYVYIIPLLEEHTTEGRVDSFTPYTVDSVANSNASNFSQAGRSLLSGLGMPSGRYIDLTLGASGSTYTAPANGYFFSSGNFNQGDGYIELVNKTKRDIGDTAKSSSNNWAFHVFVPCQKGDQVHVFYAGSVNLTFLYAEGDQ